MSNILEYLVCAALTAGLVPPAVEARAAGDEADAAMQVIRPEAIRGNMRFLSDDRLEGRGTATRGHEIAAKFMASEFESLGLAPAGDLGTYLQNVPLRSVRVDETKTSLALVCKGIGEKLVFRTDFIAPGDKGRAETSVEGPVVYVGLESRRRNRITTITRASMQKEKS